MIFHSTKSKNDLIFGFGIGKHSLTINHLLTHNINYFSTNFTAVTK